MKEEFHVREKSGHTLEEVVTETELLLSEHWKKKSHPKCDFIAVYLPHNKQPSRHDETRGCCDKSN